MSALALTFEMVDDARAILVERGARNLDTVIFDDKFHRAGTEKNPAGTDFSYKAFSDAPYTVTWKNYHTGEEGSYVPASGSEARKLTPAELADQERRKRDRQAKDAEERAAATRRAQREYADATVCVGHGYLAAKGTESVPGLAVDSDGWLIIPACNEQGELSSVQRIPPRPDDKGKWPKLFLKRAPKAGCFFGVGDWQDPDRELLIAEGIATAISLHVCTGYPVLVAFDAGNMLSVGKSARRMFPDREITVCADYDAPSKGHPEPGGIGLAKAAEVARAIRARLFWPEHPDQPGTPLDSNDLHAGWGAETVAHQFGNRSLPGDPGKDNAVLLGSKKSPAIPPTAANDNSLDSDPGCAFPPADAYEAEPEAAKGKGKRSTKGQKASVPETLTVRAGATQPAPLDIFPHRTSRNRLLATLDNFEAMLLHYGISLRYDAITKRLECDAPGAVLGGDDYLNNIASYIVSLASLNGLPTTELGGYMNYVAQRHEVNPVADWIVSKPWDGRERVQQICDAIVCDEAAMGKKLKEAYLIKWMISAVAAAFRKADDDFRNRGVLVLQGRQEMGKTTYLRTLAGGRRWFKEGASLDPTNKDSLSEVLGHWIVELGEIESTLRRDMARLKAFLTRGEDELRKPYGRAPSKYPRRTVFAGSVNRYDFLNDDTGNTRFWCIPCTEIKRIDGIDIQQVWAEIRVLFDRGAQWWLTSSEAHDLVRQNQSHELPDPIAELLASKLDVDAHLQEWTWRTTTEILIECGIREPNRSQATTAGAYLQARQFRWRMRPGKGVKEYELPPVLARQQENRREWNGYQ